MIEIRGKRLTLRTMTRAEYHQSRRRYTPDPLMDPDPYQYNPVRADQAFDLLCTRENVYPHVGIFLPDGPIIGCLCFKRIDRDRGRCEVGIALDQDVHKGQGYGSEAFALAIDYAFDTLNMARVYADTMGSNVRMRRIMERQGFRCYSRLQNAYDMRGRWEDRLDYVLDRSVWERRRNTSDAP